MARHGGGDSKKCWLALFVLITLPVLIYSNSLHNSFHYDDIHSIINNYFIRNPDNILRFFLSNKYFSGTLEHSGSYRPILLISYILNYHFGQLDPFGYHVINLLIHVLMSLLVFFFARRFFNNHSIAFWSSLVFAATPFNTEAVNYITARSSSMSALFYLSSFYCYMLFRQNGGRLKVFKYILFLLFFLMSWLVKESSITLPLLIFIYDMIFVFKRKNIKEMLLPYTPLLFGGLLIVFGPFSNPLYLLLHGIKRGVFYPTATSIMMLFEYIRIFFFPVNLVLDHDVLISQQNITSITFPLLFICFLLFLIYKNRTDRRLVFLSSWFFITLLPVLFLPFLFSTAIFQDNRGYLSGLALALILGSFIARFKKPIFFGLPIIIIFSIASYQRNTVWLDDFTLWSDVAKKNKTSHIAHHSLGIVYEQRGEINNAMLEYKRAIELDPNYYLSYNNLGKLYFDAKEMKKAMEFYDFALKLNSAFAPAHLNKAYILMAMGKNDKAIASLESAIKYNPNNPAGYMNLGYIYQQKRMPDKAIEYYTKLLEYDPASYEALSNLGLILLQSGKIPQAIEYFQRSLESKPDHLFARMNLAGAYKKQKNYSRALKEYENVLSYDKSFVEAHYFRGLLFHAMGDKELAVKAYKSAIKYARMRKEPRYQPMINNARRRITLLSPDYS